MIGRRTFLKWGTAAPIVLSNFAGSFAAAAGPQNTVLIIDNLGPETDAEKFSSVCDAILAAGVPITCLIDFPADKNRRIDPETAVATVLRGYVKRLPGLFEIVPVAAELATLTPFFQARAAHQARIDLMADIWGDAATAESRKELRTIACEMVDDPFAPSGLRASGFRNVLMRPTKTTAVAPEAWDDGVLRMIGGRRLKIDRAEAEPDAEQRQKVEQVIYLSAEDISKLPTPNLSEMASEFANKIQSEDGINWSTPVLASDLQFRDAYGYARNLGLHFVLGKDASVEGQVTLDVFRQELKALGIPSSFGAPTDAGMGQDRPSGYWVDVQGPAISDGSEHALPRVDLKSTRYENLTSIPTPEAYGLGIALSDWNDPANTGLGALNELRVPAFRVQDAASVARLSEAVLGAGDFVIVATQTILNNRATRSAFKFALIGLTQDGITSPKALPEYARAIVPNGPYITHFRRTVAYSGAAQPKPKTLSAADVETYMNDARIAWQYFERWTNKKTGLCPATVSSPDGVPTLHEAVTMWDVGSQINALIAAVDIKLITEKQFQTAIKKILPNIAGRKSQGRLLPQGWIATDKIKWGTKNFDGCDAGRLMAALYNLDSHPLAKDKAAPTVNKWDLSATVLDGVIYSVQNGELETTFKSHCAHYAAWAYRTWGIDVRSPYEVFDGNTDADGQMRLLEASGNIGPMGAEPLLLEAIELGMSPESAYLADVLFAAQLEEFDMTGKLTCVSEGPIDRDPWFTYQGLQFDAEGRVWATDTVAGLPEHRSKEFREKNAVISSKAAYLWAAYKDHDYCDSLVNYVRERAQTPYGYSSSIYRNTGRALPNYADINTNAIILQSIARILKTAKVL
ncbi:MAG: DUF3131 domain-containing protein [Sulfitobacter sp.]